MTQPPEKPPSFIPESTESSGDTEAKLIAMLNDLIDLAIEVSGADLGIIQLLDPVDSQLNIVAHRGLPQWWLDHWKSVKAGHGASGTDLKQGKRVLVEHIEESPIFTGPDLETLQRAGVCAIQSTPILSGADELIGILSAYYKQPSSPDQQQCRLLDLLSHQAADIIECRQTWQALQRADTFSTAILKSTEEGVFTLDQEGRVTYMNPAAERIFGWSFDEVRGKRKHGITHHHHRDGRPFPAADCVGFQSLKHGKSLKHHEDVFIRKDGTFFDAVCSTAPMKDHDDTLGQVVVFRDVTERKASEEALRESEDHYRNLFRHAPDAIIIAKSDKVVLVNDACVRLFAANTDRDLIDKSLFQIVHPNSHAVLQDCIHRVGVLRHNIPCSEQQVIRFDDITLDVELVIAPYSDDDPHAIQLIIHDITKRKALERRVIKVISEEQVRFGIEIHDGIGQKLTALGLLAKSLGCKLTLANRLEEAELVSQLERHIDETLNDARALAHGLSPLDIKSIGLAGALTLLVEQTQSLPHIQCRLESIGETPPLIESVSMHLYRIAQEAISNALRHSGADIIRVGLNWTNYKLLLWVSDNGVNCQPKQKKRDTLGTTIMHYRADLIGAKLEMGPNSSGTGTLVSCALPVSPHSRLNGTRTEGNPTD